MKLAKTLVKSDAEEEEETVDVGPVDPQIGGKYFKKTTAEVARLILDGE